MGFFLLTFAPRVEEHVDGALVVVAEDGGLVVSPFHHVYLQLPLAHDAVRGREDADDHRLARLLKDLGAPLAGLVLVREDELHVSALARLGMVAWTKRPCSCL